MALVAVSDRRLHPLARSFEHILGNMLALFFLGRDMEDLYGPKEFLRLYLAMVVFAIVAWNVVNKIAGTPLGCGGLRGLGGDRRGRGAVCPELPYRTLLLFFVIPMPAWLFGVLNVAWDMSGRSAECRVERRVFGPPGRRGVRPRLRPAAVGT